MKESRLIHNIITPLLTHGLLLIVSIMASKLVLAEYGSETNGLISSVNQIFGYLALLEAGIGTATTQALYTASNRDKEKTQDILLASQYYFRSSARVYFLCVVAISFAWPLLVNAEIPYWSIWGMIFFQGVASVISFCYTSTITCYLSAVGSHYVNNNVHFCSQMVTYLLKILISLSNLDITCISLGLVAVNVGKCVFLRCYMKNAFPDFFVKKKADKSLLRQRNSFLVHEISGIIFYSTDTIVISVFCGLTEASIYAVYSLVLSALRNIIGQVFSGTKYVLGNTFNQNRDDYNLVHDTYSDVYLCMSFIVYTVAFLLLIPFVSLYTKGISDAEYVHPVLPVLFVLIELLSASRIVDAEVIRFSYHAQKTIGRTVTEAVLNLTVSLICVQFIGIYGVLLGTIVALGYRSNDIVLYTNHRILKQSAKKEYARCLVNFAVFAVFVWQAEWIRPEVESFPELFCSAIVIFVGVTLTYLVINVLISGELRMLLRKVMGKTTETL